MASLSVLYPKNETSHFDFDYYIRSHVPLVRETFKEFGLEGVRLLRGTMALDGSVPAFELIGELTFSSAEQLQLALRKYGQEIISDIANFTNTSPLIQINERL